ncbi:CE1759 family FMN reductase [Streptomyces sp. NBC_00887]|uniref:CE1759 family FMN reductase n=1 Tax=Streptomyces sp. NBC_00887 TaxID=2975859 RepID=UPI00386C2BFA|nr:NAD(P)H-dependent oxidoreductase [Streptomyces sp. NBC_00887]WSY36267.1 NAD(P)H-dependent oxidoreductase [Streptomyces sp. NBC_00887]
MNNVPTAPQQIAITVVNAGVSDPSSTRLLSDRIAQKSIDALREIGIAATVRSIDLGPLAVEIARSIVSGIPDAKVKDAIAQLAESDAIIAATPVYKAGISGLFKSFADLIDNDLLIAKPVILAATGGSARHSMVVDDHLRPLFAFLRTIPMPTSLYAVPEDWGSTDLGKRIVRAAGELAAVLHSGAARDIADGNWAGYQHTFGGNATRAERSVEDVDFDTDLMRLATGGTAHPPAGDRAEAR